MRITFIALNIIILFLSASPAQAIIRVFADGSGAYPDIQSALYAAADGDTVEVGVGTFSGPGNRNLEFVSNVLLRSAFGYDQTTIDCEGLGRAFTLTEETSGTIEGLTIRNGYAAQGGAIFTGWGYYIFEDCLFMDNHATDSGGAYHGTDEGVINFRGCIFSHNTAGNTGGAIHATGSSALAIQQSTFVRNGAPAGGSLYLADGAAAQVDNTIMAFGLEGAAFDGYYYAEVEFNCSNLYANRGGDWVNGASGHANLNEDPRLSDPMAQPAPDVDLTADSPCRAGNNSCQATMGAGDEIDSDMPAYGIKADGSGLFDTLNEASHSVPHGGIIVLEDSHYTGAGAANLMLVGVSMTSRAGNPENCTIDISGQDASVFFYTDAIPGSFFISGITFTGGVAASGPLVNLSYASGVSLSNCVFTDNYMFGSGRLLDAHVSTLLFIDNCEFTHNSRYTNWDEPLFKLYGDSYSEITFQDCDFSHNDWPGPLFSGDTLDTQFMHCTMTNNTAHTLFRGGVGELTLTNTNLTGNTLIDTDEVTEAALLQITDAELTMNYCDVLNNTSEGNMVYTDECQISVYDCLMQGNTAANSGGAMRLRYTTGSVRNSHFESNGTTGGDGGAISVTASGSDSFTGTLDIESCTFLSNHCTSNGGAIYAGATGFYYDGMDYGYQNLTVNITGCTLHGNIRHNSSIYSKGQIGYSSHVGGGFTETGDLYLNVNQCLITGGVGVRGISGQLAGGATSIDCSNIHGNQGGDWVEDWLQTALIQPGNFSAAPLYCDADAGDLTLNSTSPCLAVNNACDLQIGALEQGCEGVSAVDEMPQGVAHSLITGNYPNPFNPRTCIRFELAQSGPVSVLLYDLSGRLVRTLIQAETLEGGKQEVFWDGFDDQGQRASAGIYLARLLAKDHQSTHKMVMIK